MVVNTLVYFVTAFVLSGFIEGMVKSKIGEFIDNRALKNGQSKREMLFGISSCFIFALGSLATRELFADIWPENVIDFAVQSLCFVIYYETYSYIVHVLLHRKPFKRYHAVHHQSVRVTPWSAYSVHPIEALFIGFSAPLFMLILPLSLGVALAFHVFGMAFTIAIHSNFRFRSGHLLLKWLNGYAEYHSKHHVHGTVNYGFTVSIWDNVFRTRLK